MPANISVSKTAEFPPSIPNVNLQAPQCILQLHIFQSTRSRCSETLTPPKKSRARQAFEETRARHPNNCKPSKCHKTKTSTNAICSTTTKKVANQSPVLPCKTETTRMKNKNSSIRRDLKPVGPEALPRRSASLPRSPART